MSDIISNVNSSKAPLIGIALFSSIGLIIMLHGRYPGGKIFTSLRQK